MIGVSRTLTKHTPCVVVIIDPRPCGFASDVECSIHPFCRAFVSMLTPHQGPPELRATYAMAQAPHCAGTPELSSLLLLILA
jgi:hypothetical protein